MAINWNDAQGTYSQWLKATTAAGTMIQRMADVAGAMQSAEADLAGAEKRITEVYAELKKLTTERDGLTAEGRSLGRRRGRKAAAGRCER